MAFLIMLSISISGLLYLFFDVAQLHFKMEAHGEVTAKERLQTIKVSLEDFRNRKENDEVWVNGKLYDISSYVIINDTALVSVLHDEGEEGVVKAIVNSFEPDDKYSSDNIAHVCKHRIHLPDGGKVLVAKYTIGPIAATPFIPLLSYFNEHFYKAPNAVIKPPPKYVSA